MTLNHRRITGLGVGISIVLICLEFWVTRSDPRDQVDPRRNIILILVDTLRTDHVGLYGYQERRATPNIDRFSRKGRWFESAWSTAPWTTPSVMSLLTSLNPAVHGYYLEGHRYASVVPTLSESIHPIAEILQSNGYRTMAVTGGGGVGSVYGFDRGFDHFFEPAAVSGEDVERGVNLALKWIESAENEKFFLFFHTYEVHLPNTHIVFPQGGSATEEATAAYDSDLAFADRHLNRLFDALEARSQLDDMLGSTEFNSRFISQDSFRQNMTYFSEHCHVIPLDRYFAGERAPDRLTIALTFDDGHLNNLDLALPVLEEFNVPATFFVTAIRALGADHLWPDWLDLGTALVDGPIEFQGVRYQKGRRGQLASHQGTLNRWLIDHPDPQATGLNEALPSELISARPDLGEYWQLLDEDDLKRLAASPLVTIGSHGLTHASFTALGRDRARDEMHRSKTWLEETTGQPVTAVAFPFGHYSRETLDDALDLGYRQLLAVDFAFSEDHSDDQIQSRSGINPYIGWDLQLAAILKGAY